MKKYLKFYSGLGPWETRGFIYNDIACSQCRGSRGLSFWFQRNSKGYLSPFQLGSPPKRQHPPQELPVWASRYFGDLPPFHNPDP